MGVVDVARRHPHHRLEVFHVSNRANLGEYEREVSPTAAAAPRRYAFAAWCTFWVCGSTSEGNYVRYGAGDWTGFFLGPFTGSCQRSAGSGLIGTALFFKNSVPATASVRSKGPRLQVPATYGCSGDGMRICWFTSFLAFSACVHNSDSPEDCTEGYPAAVYFNRQRSRRPSRVSLNFGKCP